MWWTFWAKFQLLIWWIKNLQINGLGSHLANNEDIGQPGGEDVAAGVFDVHNVEGAGVTLPVGDHADTTQIGTAGHHAHVAWKRKGRS